MSVLIYMSPVGKFNPDMTRNLPDRIRLSYITSSCDPTKTQDIIMLPPHFPRHRIKAVYSPRLDAKTQVTYYLIRNFDSV